MAQAGFFVESPLIIRNPTKQKKRKKEKKPNKNLPQTQNQRTEKEQTIEI
jgi:hypothetical protein